MRVYIDSGGSTSKLQTTTSQQQDSLQSSCSLTKQSKTTKATLLNSFGRVILMISFATLFQQAYGQTTTSGAIFTSCATGWSKGTCSGTGCKADCTPLYGGFASLSSVSAGSYAYKGTTSVIAASSGHNGWQGWYVPSAGSTYPTRATQGYYVTSSYTSQTQCFTGSSTKACSPTATTTCANGQYALQQTSGSVRWTICYNCPAGYYCSGGSITQVTAGYYTVGNAVTQTGCSAGYYCPDVWQATQIACPTGTYSSANAQSCTLVTAGYVGNGASGQAACGAGFYSKPGITGCVQCSAGYYCPAGSLTQIPCPTGTYTSSLQTTTCTSCPYQYYCNPYQVINVCPEGQTSALGISSCSPCPAGYYCTSGAMTQCPTYTWSTIGQSYCQNAYNGYQIDSAQASQGTMCGVGYYSNSGTNYVCTISSNGYWVQSSPPVAQTQCTPVGYWFCVKGTAGWSATNDGTLSPIMPALCPPWYDCTNWKMCPDGQYLASDTVTCTPCPAGYTCNQRYQANNAPVSTGYYSPVGVSTQFICPGGYDCSTNVATACPTGYYSAEAQVTCLICPLYWACPNPELDYSLQIDCRTMRGMYTPAAGQTACTPAPAGYYIPLGATTITACPPGTWSAGAAQACHECPPGYICPSTTTPAMSMCIQGTYNLLYSQTTCNTCEAGYYCLAQTRGPCPTFKYSLSGWGYCTYAPAGYYFKYGDNTQIWACPSGTYSLYGSADSTLDVATCNTCPVGNQCPDPSQVPQPCPPGYYQPSSGQTYCLACGTGTYSLFHETECHTSPGGYKLASPSNVPRMCPSGTYSSSGASSCIQTGSWWYAPAGSSDQFLNQQNCPWNLGLYCYSDGTKSIEITLTQQMGIAVGTGGYYLPSIVDYTSVFSTITACNQGYYCPYGEVNQYPCPAGHYCPSGSSLPTPCPKTYFQPLILQTSISSCYANTCPAQYFCNAGSKYPQICSGTCDTSLMYSFTPVTCPDGTYAGNDNPTSTSGCNACWAGYYCPAALASAHTFPIPCPKGTYNTFPSQSSLTACLPCDVGVVCPYYGQRTQQTGLVCQPGTACPAATTGFALNPCPAGQYSDKAPYLPALTDCTQTCPDGYMCSAGTNVLYNPMSICPAGYYCKTNIQTQCPAGTYSTRTGISASTQCIACPAGYYCVLGTTDYTVNVCPAGYYCPEGSSVGTTNGCPSGTFSTATGMKSSSECTICPVGYYCLSGSIVPVACPAGTYSSRISVVALVDGASRGCIACPAGYYCADSPTFEPVACPAGSYSAASATSCTLCPVNTYCDKIATTSTGISTIPNGFYYAGGPGLAQRPYHTNPLYSCPPGAWCAANVITYCQVGTYQPLYGQTSAAACLTTPAGFFTNTVGSSGFWDNPCPAGMYCPAGTISNLGYSASANKAQYPVLCPAGTFRSQTMAKSIADCGACPAGYVCSELTINPLICSPGFYCPQASAAMLPCPSGTYASGYGLTASTDCTPCFGGRYCMSQASAYVTGLCDQMYYCVQNSNTPVPQYKSVGQTTDFSGRIFPVGDVCAAGGYCAKGSKFPLPCPAGQYNPSTSKQYSTDCQACPATQYCAGTPDLTRTDILPAMTYYVPGANPTGLCYAGYYCTGSAFSPKQFTAQPGYYTGVGASAQVPCGAGTYNPFYAQPLSGCLACPAGFYCPTTAMTAPTICPQGYYCPANTINYALYPCPTGTYGIYTGLQQSSDCQPCTSGVYCGTTALTAPTGTCSAGYYCYASAVTATPSGTTNPNYGRCPAQHWCAAGVGMGTPSLPGYYDTSVGLSAQTTVKQVAGKWAHTVTATASIYSGTPTMQTGFCQAGYYCVAGSVWAFDSTHYCQIGEYCPAGATAPTACPAGTYQPNNVFVPTSTSSPSCYTCPKGFYCPLVTPGSGAITDLTNYQCPKGYYCPAGTSSQYQYPCATGTYNDHYGATSSAECVKAPPGYYQPVTAATQVTLQCSGGYYCQRGETSATPSGKQCTVGYYCPQGAPKMIPCTSGQRCTTIGLSTPDSVCPAGYYCVSGTGNSNGQLCQAGYYCPQGSSRPTPCPAGTYNPNVGQSVDSQCLACPATYYCPNPAMTTYTTYTCQAGFYCPTGLTMGSLTIGSRVANQFICMPGYYCPAQSSAMLLCSSLTPPQYQDQQGASSCKTCPIGYYCSASTTVGVYDTATKCQPQLQGKNFYCPGGSVLIGQVACPAGTYNYVDGSNSTADCWTCPPGYYCPTNAATYQDKIMQCPAGYYCFAGVTQGTICPIGFYCPQGTNAPIPCPNGFYCSSTGLQTAMGSGSCQAGYYCGITSRGLSSVDSLCINMVLSGCVIGAISATQVLCPQGNYCPTGTVIPTPCPIGTYSAAFGNTAVTDCIACTAGKYCYSRGLTAPTLNCDPGYYCPAGSTSQTAQECPVGYYCPAGQPAPILCPAGQYNPNQVQSSCLACPSGYYCPTTGMTAPIICETGYYCSGTQKTAMVGCPEGTFSYFDGLGSVQQCLPCSYGKYCTLNAGNSGTTLPSTSISDAQECPELFSCYNPTAAGFTVTNQLASRCTVGQICPANTIVPQLCPPGTYTDPTKLGPSTDNTLCLPCPLNYYCPDWGLTQSQLQLCPDGYVCLGGAIDPSNLDDVTIKLCDAGSYCSQATVVTIGPENLCQLNTFNPMPGQSVCQPCIAGFDCQELGLVTPNPCPVGYYCPAYDASSGIDNVVPCPAGTYSQIEYLSDESQCTPCPPGKYCLEASAGYTGLCSQGYVCTGGQSTPTPTGTFSFDDYLPSRSGPCPVGHYCIEGSSYPVPCPSGTYQSQTGQYSCTPCDAGSYCASAGLSSPTGTCAQGFYCISGSVYAQPYDFQTGRICAIGHYCTGGLEYQCPGGYYAPVNGLAVCYDCPPGFYCNYPTGTITPLECTTGRYCPAKTKNPIVCPLGTYTQSYQKGLDSLKQCAQCPTGYYCNDGTYNITQKCAAGFYCLSGASQYKQVGLECPSGYYCTSGTKLPTACPDGKYSLPGAKTINDCVLCIAGFYCVRYISSSAMVACPAGNYCPQGVNDPIPCPKGTYNIYTKSVSSDSCLMCPAGTACDTTGVADFSRKLCPPGYYCPLNTITPVACPAGQWRPSQGGASAGNFTYSANGAAAQGCYMCVGGYYCPTKATVVPELCPRGSYCVPGSQQPVKCPAGFYCNVGVTYPVPCPPGFFCLGSSDTYNKCPFGTYCPKGTARPIPCPNGYYGSGNNNNFDLNSGCLTCGRGLYSEDDPTQCQDCTPGYVCVQATSSSTPTDNSTQGGYKCPTGSYCPLGSFQPTPCPAGTYSKYQGSTYIGNCLPCKIDWYQNLPGQGGCKACGPTSTASGGATICTCVGANRNFIMSSGACLCTTGYQPKDGAPNVDSAENCELIVQPVCTSDQQVSLNGTCLSASQQVTECKTQCGGGAGTMISGTGLCQCAQIQDVSSICDKTCQSKMPQTSLSANGTLLVSDPVTGKTSSVDPSNIPGYVGNFQCQTPSTAGGNCQVQTMGINSDGSFTYNFQPNSDILNATQIPNNTNYTTAAIKKALQLKKLQEQGASSRSLATVTQTTVPELQNPTMCIKAGGVVFFNVNPSNLNYPVYYLQSILNTNKAFDSAPFDQLAAMIASGTPVSTFSYVFTQPGTYVFQNKGSGTVTVITVVDPSQNCGGSNSNGVSVQPVTQQTLASQGVQSGSKGIQPNWWFISLTIIAIVSFVFFVMGLFIIAHNAQIKGTSLFAARSRDDKSSSIYYDKVEKAEREQYRSYCLGLCKRKIGKVDNKNSSDDSSDENPSQKKHEYNVKYKDLEKLLSDFHRAQDVLNKQLIDREARKKRTIDENGNLIEQLTNEDTLLKEVQSLLQFVKQNRACLNNTLSLNQDKSKDEDAEKNKDKDMQNKLSNDLTRKVAVHLQTLAQKNLEQEKIFSSKLVQQAKDMQQAIYQKEAQRNDMMKTKLLDEYQRRLQNTNLEAKDREVLLAELHAKMSLINDIAADEQDKQQFTLQQMLEQRKMKKEKLQAVLQNLGERRVKEDDRYQQKFVDIKQREIDEKKLVDSEMEELRKKSMYEIQEELNQKRLKTISEAEKKLEEFKRKQGKGHNPEAELIFADMLSAYGQTVKKLDQDLLKEKDKLQAKLEEKLKDRKQSRLREIEEQRKQKEQLLNADTVNNNAKITTEMKQIESLLNPIKDEQARMEIITQQQKSDQAIAETQDNRIYQLSTEANAAQKELSSSDDTKAIQTILNKIDVENEVKRREIENQKELINRQLQNCKTDEERWKLMKQLEAFEANLQSQLAQQQEVQNKRLKEAIEARKHKRRVLMDKVTQEKESAIFREFRNLTSSKVTDLNQTDQLRQLVHRIQAGFSKDESVQVCENYVESKHQQELIALMNSLFEEQANALRQFMLDLLTGKQADFDLLLQEYEPQKEFLRSKRVKGLLTLEEFTSALERLTIEETERHQDIEIAYADKEKEIKAELEVLKLEADNEQSKVLKERQTKEKLIIFQELMKNLDEKDQMKVYLNKSINEVNRELQQFIKLADKEKQHRIQEMKEERERKRQEMHDRQERLVNVEEALKRDEAKHMERFRRQREEMLARKLAEQQRELLKEMNQKDVDTMLEKHKKDLAAMDEVLSEEQTRQMEKMRLRMKGRNAAKAREQVVRQIKLAEIQQAKAHEAEQAKLYEAAGGDLATSIALERQREQMNRLVEKANLMQRTCQKQCYSRRIFFKRHIANQQKLNSFLGRGILADWASSKGGYPDDVSGMSQLSLNTEDLKAQVNDREEKITYSVLLQHIETAERTYEQVRKNQ